MKHVSRPTLHRTGVLGVTQGDILVGCQSNAGTDTRYLPTYVPGAHPLVQGVSIYLRSTKSHPMTRVQVKGGY
ncbi:hypothetical protein BJX96DRAFT_148635, partial [Aspergillus floccosus]